MCGCGCDLVSLTVPEEGIVQLWPQSQSASEADLSPRDADGDAAPTEGRATARDADEGDGQCLGDCGRCQTISDSILEALAP